MIRLFLAEGLIRYGWAHSPAPYTRDDRTAVDEWLSVSREAVSGLRRIEAYLRKL